MNRQSAQRRLVSLLLAAGLVASGCAGATPSKPIRPAEVSAALARAKPAEEAVADGAAAS